MTDDITKIILDAVIAKVEKWRRSLIAKSQDDLKDLAELYTVYREGDSVGIATRDVGEEYELICISILNAELEIILLEDINDDGEEIWKDIGTYYVANPDFLEKVPAKVVALIANDIREQLDQMNEDEAQAQLDLDEEREREQEEEEEEDY